MRRPGPLRRRDYAWAVATGIFLLSHTLAGLGVLIGGVVRHEAVDLLRVPALLVVTVLEGTWLVLGCWRRTWWGQPDEEAIAEAARPLTHRQRRWMAGMATAGLVAVLALGIALALQLLQARHR